MSPPLLSVEHLDVVYDGTISALTDVSLSVAEGQVVAVLGSNGAGKTSLLRAISRALDSYGGAVTGGTVRFAGEDLAGLDTAAVVRRGLVQVPEGRRVFRDLSVEDNLRAGGYTVRDAKARAEARDRVFDLFPILAERRNQPGGLLSGGQQQMLAMGRALMAAPKLLLLDEPSLGLAPLLVDQIGEIVTEINRQGTAVLLIEQNAVMGLRVADAASVLEVGRVTAAGTAAELSASDEVQERYLGVAVPEVATEPVVVAEPEIPTAQPPQRLSVEGLTVRFGGITALSDVSFDVEPGTVHALIGPNGAGKSTLVNVLGGAYRATEGTVHYGAEELTALPAHRVAGLGVARTFQNISLALEDTVEDNLLVGRHRLMRSGVVSGAFRWPRVRREEREHRSTVGDIAELLGIAHLLRTPVHTLSYGDRKRVEMGRALAARPSLLLLDEPVAGMTHGESQDMAETIRQVRRDLGLSIVLVEHDMPFVMGLAEQVTVLDFGKKIAEGTPAEVQRDPEVVRAYLGISGMSYFLEQVLNGLSYGLVLSLIAAGFAIVFTSTGVLNFAHGSVVLLGAYLVAVLHPTIGFWPAVLVAMAGAALVGVLINALLVRNLADKNAGTAAILMLGVDIVLLTELTRRIGNKVLTLGAPWGASVVRIGDVSLPAGRVVAAGATVIAFAGLWYLFSRTDLGVGMRAAAADGPTASLMGIRLSRTAATGWALAGVLAAVAGVFLTSFPAPGVAPTVALSAFAAIPAWVLGGFDSVPGAVVGGLLIGLTSALVTGYESDLSPFLGTGFGEVAPYVVMIVVLLVRPSGLLGSKEAVRV